MENVAPCDWRYEGSLLLRRRHILGRPRNRCCVSVSFHDQLQTELQKKSADSTINVFFNRAAAV